MSPAGREARAGGAHLVAFFPQTQSECGLEQVCSVGTRAACSEERVGASVCVRLPGDVRGAGGTEAFSLFQMEPGSQCQE